MWPSYVINLADNAIRLASCSTQLSAQGIAFERLEATNGWTLPEREVALVYDEAANRRRGRLPLVRPEIGCYLSHIEAWRRIATGTSDGGFVFEDDIHAAEDLRQVMELLSEEPRDWDMVKLFSLDSGPKCVARRALGPAHDIVVPYRVPTCLMGYGLSREAARILADRAIPFFRPVDEDQKFFWETGLRVALVLPAPITVGDQRAETGTVGTERREAGKTRGADRFRQSWRGLLYMFRYTALLHYHRARKGTP